MKINRLGFLLAVFAACSSASLVRDVLSERPSIDSVQWSDDPAFVESIINSGVPVLLTGPKLPTQDWRAMQWTPDYVSTRSTATIGIKTFDKPKLTIGCCKLRPVTLRGFWDLVEAAHSAGEYVYLNAELEMLGPSLNSDVARTFLPTRQSTRTGVWMGSSGSTAPLHHDPFENFFVQVYGRKRFYLFSPADFSYLYLFPKTSPRNRQSQIDLDAAYDSSIEAAFPELKHAKLLVVDLNEGDVMYLPPFWFHQVESLSASISINVWYDSDEVSEMDRAWDEPLPFSLESSFSDNIILLRELLLRIVQTSLESAGSHQWAEAHHFIQTLVNSRYVPIFGPTPIKVNLLQGVETVDDPHLRVHLREQTDLDSSRLVQPGDIEKLSLPEWAHLCSNSAFSELAQKDSTLDSLVNDAALAVANHFIRAPDSLSKLHLADFVEDLVGQVVGDEFVYLFLGRCGLQGDPSHETAAKDEL